jgi:hypothetical protein
MRPLSFLDCQDLNLSPKVMASFLHFLGFRLKVQSFHQCLSKMVAYHPYLVFPHCPILMRVQQRTFHRYPRFPEPSLNPYSNKLILVIFLSV